MAHLERVIILIDMDCFYCQVEEKLDSNLEGKPIAVVQYNDWRGGGIIAVNYPARDQGVKRGMRGNDAKQKCPDIVLASVPEVRGKADLSKYRDAGKKVAEVLQTFTDLLERASIDEAYLDVTNIVLNRMKNGVDQISIDKLKNTFVVGCDTINFIHNLKFYPEYSESNLKLCLGGIIAEEVRAEVLKQTGYKCSAGIAHNKILAKLVCGLNKPNKQTIIPHDAVSEYFENLPLKKVRSLGGKFGYALSEELGISKMGELVKFSEKHLVEKYGKKNGSWLYNIAKGIDSDPVVTRLVSKSIGCCKRFPGKTVLLKHDDIIHWMNELAAEVSERLKKDLEENNRRAKQMIVSFSEDVIIYNKFSSNSRTHPLNSYDQSHIANNGVEVVRKCCQKSDGSYHVTFLGISVSNFQEQKKTLDITSFFNRSTNSKFMKKTEVESKKHEENVTIEDNTTTTVLETAKDSSEETNTDNEDQEHSIYSVSTEDLEEDSKSYIYFEDIFPEFVSTQPLEVYQSSAKANSSIAEDVEYSREQEMRETSSRSFFSKYFESASENNTPELDASFGRGDQEGNIDCNNVSSDSTQPVDEHIGKDGMTNQQTFSVPEKQRKSNEFERANTSIKRKVSEINILQYFSKTEEPNENYCDECKKNIPIEDILDHSDYHVAKKLQAELNRTLATNAPPAVKSKDVKQRNKKAANMSISKFFKPV